MSTAIVIKPPKIRILWIFICVLLTVRVYTPVSTKVLVSLPYLVHMRVYLGCGSPHPLYTRSQRVCKHGLFNNKDPLLFEAGQMSVSLVGHVAE